MLPSQTQQPPGSFRLFRLFGIDVYLHWMWFLLLIVEVTGQRGGYRDYESRLWNLIEFLSIFGIVLMHEFGHALACRSVGGRADRIVLWLLGGVAFVQPPPRPGAVLWSIAAGPLVNLILVPVTLVAIKAVSLLGGAVPHDVQHFVFSLAIINMGILIFNMLPIYPLDGGQILQSLLWYVIGRAKSLHVVAVVGVVVGAVGVGVAVWYGQPFLVLMGLFIAWQSYNGLRAARYLAMMEERGIDIG